MAATFKVPAAERMPMGFAWPPGFERVPDEDWTRADVERLAQKYDSVVHHGWYANLDPTVDELRALLGDGDVLVDYSGGTGILADRLLAPAPRRRFGVVIVDSSPKFLRLALEKLRHEPAVAFRLLRWRADEKRLDFVDEALGPPLASRGVDALVSTNAVHLYHDLAGTARAWTRVLKPTGRVLVQSGDIRLPPDAPRGWILDDTVRAVAVEAERVVEAEARFSRFRPALEDAGRMAKHAAFRDKVFVPARDLDAYLAAFAAAGLHPVALRHRAIPVRTGEWEEFLDVYHEAILGWAGGVEKIDGRAAAPDDVALRRDLLRASLARVLRGAPTFHATWTYLTLAPRPF